MNFFSNNTLLASKKNQQNSDETVLLLHFDGADNSTTFVDSSPNNLTVTRNGNAIISTTQSKFGGSSAYFDENSILNMPYGSWVTVGTDDFTFEAWIYPMKTGFQHIFGRHIYGFISMYLIILNDNNQLTLYENSTGSGQFRSSGLPVSTNTWSHICITRRNGLLKLFVNGIEGNSYNIPNSLDQILGFNNFEPVSIGGPYNQVDWMFNGYIDELRLIKGASLYNANFTPPNSPFTL